MELERLGWNSFFAENFREYAEKGYSVGRVYQENRRSFWLYTKDGEIRAEISGKFMFHVDSSADFPAVGDWVVFRFPKAKDKAVIDGILPRFSKFSRKVSGSSLKEQIVATNINKVMLVIGLDNDFNLRRIERYLVMINASGASPVIILNKIDLCQEFETRIAEVKEIAQNTPIASISASTNNNLAALQNYFKEGETVALIGSSGVGKSTITNQLLGYEKQKVREVRATDDRGQHTTTKRELIILAHGGLIMDTPGMRELQLWVSEKGLENSFADIQELSSQCFYRNCEHQENMDCAIQKALSDGSLEKGRWENYNKLIEELMSLQEKRNKPANSKKLIVKKHSGSSRKTQKRK